MIQKNITVLIDEILQKINCPGAKASIPDPRFGYIAINAPIILAKQNKSNPKDEFNNISSSIATLDEVLDVNFAAGFCNITLKPEYILQNISWILKEGDNFGKIDLGKGQKVNIEYISANPTGPMHLGHLRGLYADVFANLLDFFGYKVTREYLINDAGNQVNILGESVRYQYCKLHNLDCDEPKEFYPGIEVKMIAESLDNPDLNDPKFLSKTAIAKMLEYIKSDLDLLNVHFDVWTSESQLHDSGIVDAAITKLEALGYIKLDVLGDIKGKKGTASGQKIKVFDGEKAVTKADGSYTYFGADLGYIYDKIQRGFDWIIYCIGSDQGTHFEYLLKAGQILAPNVKISAIYFQSVDMIKNGERAKFSKRGGIAFRPSELNLPDINIFRYMMESKKNDTHFSINIDQMREISMQNMFYYVQYAHARGCSILRNAGEMEAGIEAEHLTPSMLHLAYKLAQWPRELQVAMGGINSIATYIESLSSAFHRIWNEGKENPANRWILDDAEITKSRITLVKAFRQVLGFALKMLGIVPYQKID